MPLSDKRMSDLLYNMLPEVYRTEDLKIEPNPQPLKRFLQVASTGLDYMESEIDAMQLLFQADRIPEKYLDAVGRMLGITFTYNTTATEKRKLIDILPTLYKLKGNDIVFELLARIIFTPDATTKVEWSYTAQTTTMRVKLTVDEYVPNLEERQLKYLELVEYFRPVNVGTSWIIEVYYTEEFLAQTEVSYDIDKMYIYDNLFGQHEYTGDVNSKPRLLNKMRLNTTAELYAMLLEKYPRDYEEIDLDTIFYETDIEELNKRKGTLEESFLLNKSKLNGRINSLSTYGDMYDITFVDVLEFLLEEEIAGMNVQDVDFDVVRVDDNVLGTRYENENKYKKLNTELYLGRGVLERYVGIFADDNSELVSTSEADIHVMNVTEEDSYTYYETLDEESTKSATYQSESRLVDHNNSLNFGRLGSTMILSKIPKVTNINY